MNESKMNLYQKINVVMKKVNYLQKDAEVGYGNNKYTALSHDKVTTSLQKELASIGIVHIAKTVDVKLDSRIVTTKNGESLRYEVSGYVVSTFFNSDNPDEKIECQSFTMAFDSQDKSPGKLFSMGAKYNLLKTFMIASGDNEEARVEEDTQINSTLKNMRDELVELLKAANNFSPNYLIDINKMNYKQLAGKISEYKNKGE